MLIQQLGDKFKNNGRAAFPVFVTAVPVSDLGDAVANAAISRLGLEVSLIRTAFPGDYQFA